MSEAVRKAIEAADVGALRALLRGDPSLVERDVCWDDNRPNSAPALHFACDVVFRKLATQEEGLALADVLLDAGADLEWRAPGSRDTLLISAASLGAEDVGLRLLQRGVAVDSRGLFGASALHWAAFMGAERLARALVVAGASLEGRDDEHECTPLEWGLHAWHQGTNGRRDGIPGVVRALVAAGATVPEGVLEALEGEEHAVLRAALS